MRTLAFSSLAVMLTVLGLAGPAHAVKRLTYSHGATCQPMQNPDGTMPNIAYTNAGVVVNSTSATFVCPIDWSKDPLSTWALLDKVDVSVDWLGLPSTATNALFGPNWGCSLVYESAGGTTFVTGLPVSYPMPAGLASVAYAALWCTVPQSMGIQGYNINMCFVSSTNPGGCATP